MVLMTEFEIEKIELEETDTGVKILKLPDLTEEEVTFVAEAVRSFEEYDARVFDKD